MTGYIKKDRTPDPDRFMSLRGAGELLDMTSDRLRDYIADGSIPAYRVGARLKLRRQDVLAFAKPVTPTNNDERVPPHPPPRESLTDVAQRGSKVPPAGLTTPCNNVTSEATEAGDS